MLSNHLILSVLFSFCLYQSFPASGSFSNGSALPTRWPKDWSFNFSTSNEYSGLISLRIDVWSPCCPRDCQESSPALQFESINSLALSLLYGPTLISVLTTGKIIALTIWNFVGKVMSLLLNTLSRFVVAFLPRSKHLLISWLQSLSTVILEPRKIKSVTASTFSFLFAMNWWDQIPWS